MPFVQILRDPAIVTDDVAVLVRDHLGPSIGEILTVVDPDHVVTAAMVDWHVVDTRPVDTLRCPVFVTVFARRERRRAARRAEIVEHLRAQLAAIVPVPFVIELVLNDHASSYDYGNHK